MTVEVSNAGYGQVGFCKICASSLKAEINKRLVRHESAPSVIAWAKTKGFSLSKPTVLKHKKHITDAKTTFVDQARANPVIKRVSHTEFLESVVSAGARRVEENPDDVTIDQSIRASQVLESRKDKSGDALNILILALTGNRPLQLTGDDVIEGSYIELLPVQEDKPLESQTTS